MKYTKNCENCIWFGQCAQEETCEHYSPANDCESDEAACAEYNNDLASRHSICMEQIAEQNS